jgi:ADP-heptose:LPS heptosyltransferase
LQVGPAAAQIAEPGLRGKIRDLSPLLTDYAETAGAITQLDLVITADTSVAHLAGSLGKPVWVLTPFAPDWRWLLERADSPWYPSMRLFRQPAAGDWESVIGAVGAALWELPGFRPEEVPDLISTGL